MGGEANQFLLLTWKNWLIQKRKKVATVLEIFLPILFTLILIIFRQIVEIEYFDEPTTWRVFNPDQFRDDLVPRSRFNRSGPGNSTWMLCYSPNDPLATQLMQDVAGQINVRVDGKF